MLQELQFLLMVLLELNRYRGKELEKVDDLLLLA